MFQNQKHSRYQYIELLINTKSTRGLSRKYPTGVFDCFFDYEGVVRHEYAPRGRTIDEEFYVKVPKRSRARCEEIGRIFGPNGELASSFNHDNASARSFETRPTVFGKTHDRSTSPASV